MQNLRGGGIVDDENLAGDYLSDISYYRLCAYTFPFQDNTNEDADHLFLDKDTIAKTKRNKLFAYLCCIKYILDIISPNNDFHKNLKSLIANGGKLLSLKDMGFPDNWNYLGIWRG